MLNLDTQILILLTTGDITGEERGLVVHEPLAISDIVLWEVAMLVSRRRIVLDLDGPEFRLWLRSLTILPITREIARQSCQLDFSSDPADEIIAATSIVEKIPLLTRDRRIRKSRMVPLAL
ncbi:MAG: PIN domain nuclease [Acidobacteria bacterium]|nr:MAG: PIN domain nuclease [Acidobacteriota bacterium]